MKMNALTTVTVLYALILFPKNLDDIQDEEVGQINQTTDNNAC